MANNLNSISDRLTPSVPIEITFSAQPVSTGTKITTLFGHMSSVGGSAMPFDVHQMVNVGDPDLAKQEVEALAGVGSQIALMAKAFVKANSAVSESRNFPAFRVVMMPYAELHFGPAQEAILAVKFLRNDMLVSCYPSSDSVNLAILQDLAHLMSGVDRDLQGQFGTFISVASIESLTLQEAYDINDRSVIATCMPDTNTAAVAGVTGDTTSGSNVIANLSSAVGINIGAQVSGTGIPAGAVVQSVNKTSITLSVAASATGAAVALTIQNVVSQAPEIIAAGVAAVMMGTVLPYKPLQGVIVGGLIPPRKTSDRIEVNPQGPSEAALAAGLSPLYVQAGGNVALLRTRTTYHLLADNVTAVTAYFDWQDLVILYDFREVCYQISINPPFNGNPGGTKLTANIAKLFKDEVLREAKSFEDLGAFQDVDALSKYFVVAISSTSRGRLDFKIPVEVVPGLFVIAGNINAVSSLADVLNTTI